jgi:queuosine precursor transporter
MTRKDRLFLWIGGLFVAALLVADLIGGKFFRVAGHDLSAGMLAFPLTFVLTDVLNEFYGPTGARRITFLGLGAAVFAFAIIQLAMALPPSPESPLAHEVFRDVFGWSTRLYVASLTAYVVGQLLDIAVFGALRRVTRHRFIWLRATGSTLVSQLVDTVVVTSVLLWGAKPAGFIAGVIRDSYVVKIVIAIGLTPVIYAAHAIVGKLLHVDETPMRDAA